MDKIEFIEDIELALYKLKDFDKFVDLMRGKNDPIGTLTRLNETLNRLLIYLKATEMKDIESPDSAPIVSPSKLNALLVHVTPVGDEYGKKSYVGFLVGDIALGSSLVVSDEAVKLDYSSYNPAIFIPQLSKIVFGCESWWTPIESLEQLKRITKEDSEDTWYAKFLKDKSSELKKD